MQRRAHDGAGPTALALLTFVLAAPAAAGDPAGGPALAALRRNLREPLDTACVRVAAVERVRDIRADDGRIGYVIVRVRADVLEVFTGTFAREVEYEEMREAPSSGPEIGATLVVSLQRRPDGTLVVGDNGDVLPASDELLQRARRLAASRAALPTRRAEPTPAPSSQASPSAACSDKRPCHDHPSRHGSCFRVRGRMSVYNGAPSIRIWPVGTTRLLGVSQQRFADPAICNLPDAIAQQLSAGDDLFADFEVCPLTPDQRGVMRLVCVDSAANLTRRPHAAPPPRRAEIDP